MTMSPEAGSQGEQNGVDPVQEARRAFNNELLGKEYHPVVLLTKTLQLHQILLRSTLSPERIYHESAVIAAQGAQRAELFEDTATAEPLREMQKGFELTYETFSPRFQTTEATSVVRPTRTADLPPMTSAKGGEASSRTTSPPTPKPAATPTSPEGSTESQEETFGSFLRQKRTEANLSQAKLGENAGSMKNLVISALELGRQKSLDEAKANQIATALGLSDEDLAKFLALYNKRFGTPPETPQQ